MTTELNEMFSVIIYDSLNIDSVICKEIILAQYFYTYSIDIENSENRVIAYDGATGKSTIVYNDKSQNKDVENFDIYALDKTKSDTIFVCGLCVDKDLIKKFIRDGENLKIFECNNFKITDMKSWISVSNNVKLYTSIDMSLSMKAIKTIIDPLNVFSNSKNIALKLIEKYSEAITLNYSSFDNVDEYEKIKFEFENNLDINRLVLTLINRADYSEEEIFNGNVDYESYKKELVDKFNYALIRSGVKWSNDIVTINDRVEVPMSEVKRLVSDEQLYSMIAVYYKDELDFWTLKLYKDTRDFSENMILAGDAEERTYPYYMTDGTPVVKKSTYWLNYTTSKKIDIADTDLLYLNKEDAVFNTTSLYANCKSKYLCIGNANMIDAYLTSKQLYNCDVNKKFF